MGDNGGPLMVFAGCEECVWQANGESLGTVVGIVTTLTGLKEGFVSSDPN